MEKILFKRTKEVGKLPPLGTMSEGELAINLSDRQLFTRFEDEIIPIGGSGGGSRTVFTLVAGAQVLEKSGQSFLFNDVAGASVDLSNDNFRIGDWFVVGDATGKCSNMSPIVVKRGTIPIFGQTGEDFAITNANAKLTWSYISPSDGWVIVDGIGEKSEGGESYVGISGRMGSGATIAATGKIPFDEFWTADGVTYDAANRRFLIEQSGTYRITFDPFIRATTTSGNARVAIMKNADSLSQVDNIGHSYSNDTTYNIGSIDSVVTLSKGDYITFCIVLNNANLYNATADRFNTFSIVKQNNIWATAAATSGGGTPVPVEAEYKVVTGNSAIEKDQYILCDISDSPIQIDLPPASPKDQVVIGDYRGTASIANPIVIHSDQNIQGKSENLFITTGSTVLTLNYINDVFGWKVVDGIGEGTSGDSLYEEVTILPWNPDRTIKAEETYSLPSGYSFSDFERIELTLAANLGNTNYQTATFPKEMLSQSSDPIILPRFQSSSGSFAKSGQVRCDLSAGTLIASPDAGPGDFCIKLIKGYTKYRGVVPAQGGGAVESVNGQTGKVVLDAT